jgi:3-oxoacyl-[acyl-carrier protein] reductase
MLSIDLTGKLALVTGASGELGRVISRTLAQSGADLLLHYHENETAAKMVARDVEGLQRRACVVSGDVGKPAGVARIAAAASEFGQPQIVVINAVEQIHPWSTVLEESVDDYESQFRSCVLQSVLLAKAFVPAMRRSGWGRIVGVNTECTMQLLPTYSAYAAAKRGMDGVLRVLAKEVGPDGITVNQVAPGWTISDKDRKDPPDDAAYCAAVPLRRRGTDREIANVVAFLASDLASYVHGAFVPVCGGNVMPTV